MADSKRRQQRELLLLRIFWTLCLIVAWGIAEALLVLLILTQLVLRLINGHASSAVAQIADSLCQWMAAAGRFATFHTDEKPWPFNDWPALREPDGEDVQVPAGEKKP